tara:strand:+ start:2658 stop:3239 length:582 start_codon:yes stop_codon:yes gene_type:complete
MYQGKILSVISHIKNNHYILHYECGLEEELIFDSFNINVSNRQYSINKMINRKINKIQLPFYNNIFFSFGFQNLSQHKMNNAFIINQDGFTQRIKKYTFKNNKDFIGIDFNIKSYEKEFKIILFFTKDNVKFIPLFFINKNFNIELINNSQFYKLLKNNFNIKNNKKNDDFFEMFNHSEYLHQNSLYLFNILE